MSQNIKSTKNGLGTLPDLVKLARSLYGLKQASRTWHYHLVRAMKIFGFEQCGADPCVMRLIENGVVTMVVVMYVDDIFSIGAKARSDQFGRDLNAYLPIKNLGELRLYAGIRFSRDRAAGTITLSQETFARSLVEKFGLTRNKEIPMVVGVKLEEFDEYEPRMLLNRFVRW